MYIKWLLSFGWMNERKGKHFLFGRYECRGLGTSKWSKPCASRRKSVFESCTFTARGAPTHPALLIPVD